MSGKWLFVIGLVLGVFYPLLIGLNPLVHIFESMAPIEVRDLTDLILDATKISLEHLSLLIINADTI